MSEQLIFVHREMTKEEYIRMVACQLAFKNVEAGRDYTVLALDRAERIQKYIRGKE